MNHAVRLVVQKVGIIVAQRPRIRQNGLRIGQLDRLVPRQRIALKFTSISRICLTDLRHIH